MFSLVPCDKFSAPMSDNMEYLPTVLHILLLKHAATTEIVDPSSHSFHGHIHLSPSEMHATMGTMLSLFSATKPRLTGDSI